MFWNPFIVRRHNSSQNLSKNRLSDWFFRSFRVFNGEFDQLGLLDYIVPIWGFFKWVAYTLHIRGDVTYCFGALFWEILATFPKYLIAILLSCLAAPVLYMINYFSTDKPQRQELADLLLEAQVVRIPDLIATTDELQVAFNKNKALFDNQVPLRQLLSAYDIVNRYFLYLVVLKDGNDLRYFITLNPLKNCKGYDVKLRTILVNMDQSTIFLELNFKNTILIKRLRGHPELAIAPVSRPATLTALKWYLRQHRSTHSQLCLKVPKEHISYEPGEDWPYHDARITQLPLSLIIPPVQHTTNYVVGSYIAMPWSNLLIERIGPRFLLDHRNKKLELLDSYFKIISKCKVRNQPSLKEKPSIEIEVNKRNLITTPRNIIAKSSVDWLTHSFGLFLVGEKPPATYFQQRTGPSFQEDKEDSNKHFLLQILTPINKEHASQIRAIIS